MTDALAGRFEILILESLDRLSRDQVESERTIRRLEHRGIRILTVDGYDSAAGAQRKMLRTFKGMIAEAYLDDLRLKTHRGLTGKVENGFIAAGKSFGYKIVKHEHGSLYEVVEAEARIVRTIFQWFVEGRGVQSIAHELNASGTPSPRGSSWAVSGIYGSPRQGTGILNNRLYIGEQIWNRSQWIKDPDTGKRERVARPESEWKILSKPELRIIDDETWKAVRERMDRGRPAPGLRKPFKTPLRTLFGGLMLCPHCGGKMIAVSGLAYGCHARKDRGPALCKGFYIPREVVDQRLVSLLRDDLLSEASAAEFAIALRAQMPADESASIGERLRKLDGDIAKLVDMLLDVGKSEALTARLRTLEAERDRLTKIPKARPIKINPVEAFSKERLALTTALKSSPERARGIIERLIGKVPLRLEGESVWGEISTGEMITLATGTSPAFIAGARNACQRLIRIL